MEPSGLLAFATTLVEQEPSPRALWTLYGLLGVAGLLACRWRVWLLLAFSPMQMALGAPLLMELWDPVVGPQLWRESAAYVIEAHAAFAVSLLLPLAGSWAGERRRQQRRARGG